MYFAPQTLKLDCGLGFPMQTTMRNFNWWISTFH